MLLAVGKKLGILSLSGYETAHKFCTGCYKIYASSFAYHFTCQYTSQQDCNEQTCNVNILYTIGKQKICCLAGFLPYLNGMRLSFGLHNTIILRVPFMIVSHSRINIFLGLNHSCSGFKRMGVDL